MSAFADPADMPAIYARQEQDPEKHGKDGRVATRRLDEDGALRPVVADAFALQEGEDGEDFKDMGWIKAGLIATCEAVALGTLSFPSNFKKLGLAGGIICNTGFVVIAWVSALLMVRFKQKYPYTMNVADCGAIIFGPWGGRIFGIGMVLKSIGLASSHILAGKIAIASFDSSATCTVVWALIMAVASAILSYNRHWSGLTYMSILSLSCIVIACAITMGAAGTQDLSYLVKNNEPIEWVAFNKNVNLEDAISAITNTIFAYGGNMAVFSFLPEMKKPEQFTRSIAIMQLAQMVIYTIVGAVMYVYGGQYVTSPALTMVPHKFRIAAYAFALVTIIVSGIVAVNVGAKYFYITLFRDTPMLTSRGLKSKVWWCGIVAGMYAVGFVLAELIPFFSQLLTIVSCLFSTWFVAGLGGIIWFHLYNPRLPENAGNGGFFATPGRIGMVVFSLFLIAMSSVITPLGLYSAIKGIISGYSNGSFHHPFSCTS